MKHLVRLIENPNTDPITKILQINGINDENQDHLFLVKLKTIKFRQLPSQVSIELIDETYRDKFNKWMDELYDILKEYDKIEEIIKRLNKEIKIQIQFLKVLRPPGREKVMGLFGELLELKKLLIESEDKSYVLDGWNRPAPAVHDFDYEDYSLEVKTVGRKASTIKISSENQLNSIDLKDLKLKVTLVDIIDKSEVDSLGIIFNEILDILEGVQKNKFEMKCAEDFFFQYLGPEHTSLDYKILEFDSFYYYVDQEKFPRISSDILDNGISNIKYKLDISAIEQFKL
jgi:hypothetical protein